MEIENLTKILKPISLEERKIFFDEEKFVKDTLEEIKTCLDSKWDFYGIIFFNCAKLEIYSLVNSLKEKLKEYNLNFKTLDLIVNDESLSNLKSKIKKEDFYFICHPISCYPPKSPLPIEPSLIKPYYQLDFEIIKKDYKKVIDNFP